MRTKIIVCLLAFIAAVAVNPRQAVAQKLSQNDLFYHSIHSPYSNSLNPALFPMDKHFYISLPRVSASLSLPMSYNDLGLQYDPNRDVTVINVNHILDQIKENGFMLGVEGEVTALGFGFKISDFSFSFSSGARTLASANIPTGLLTFITEGNAGGNQHIDFGAKQIANVVGYGYAALGASFKIPTLPITVGARANILDGVQIATIDNLSIDLATAQDMSSLTLSSDFMAHSAGLVNVNVTDSSFSFNPQLKFPRNLGFTFDLGIKATLGIVDLSLSVLDLGPGIKWKESPITIVPKHQETTISFDGVDLTAILDGGSINSDMVDAYGDSIRNMIAYIVDDQPFRYSLPTRTYLGASVTLSNYFRAGYLFMGQWNKGMLSETFRCNNSLSIHANLLNWLEISAANSFSYDSKSFSWFNPGASLTILSGPVQTYISADYISSIYVASLKSMHLYFGINIVL